MARLVIAFPCLASGAGCRGWRYYMQPRCRGRADRASRPDEDLRAGAGGYLLKDAEPPAILGAIQAVHRGESVLSPAVATKLLASIERDRPTVGPTSVQPGSPDGSDLTERELGVLRLLARGQSNPEIAANLFVSESTVKANLTRIMAKLEVRDRVQLIIRAAQLGLVTLALD